RLVASAVPVGDPSLGQVVRRHFHLDLVAGENADVVLAHAPGDVRDDLVAVLQLHPEHGVREGFGDRAFKFNDVVFRHASWTAAGVGRGNGRQAAYSAMRRAGAQNFR